MKDEEKDEYKKKYNRYLRIAKKIKGGCLWTQLTLTELNT